MTEVENESTSAEHAGASDVTLITEHLTDEGACTFGVMQAHTSLISDC